MFKKLVPVVALALLAGPVVAADAPATAPAAEQPAAPAKSHHKKHSKKSAKSAASKTDAPARSEEHTSELQSQSNIVCRLLLEKKKRHDLKIARIAYVQKLSERHNDDTTWLNTGNCDLRDSDTVTSHAGLAERYV